MCRQLMIQSKGYGRGTSDLKFSSPSKSGFTLIELLVVVAIIALLIAILLPGLHQARAQARASACLSNQKQIGIGLTGYVGDNRDRYPVHSSPSSTVPRTRWPDYLHRYMQSEEVYECPGLTEQQQADFRKPFAHTVDRATGAVSSRTKFYGGYGYNFQYLGNARTKKGPGVPSEWAVPFHASASAIRMPGVTLAVADTRGSKAGDPSRAFGEKSAAVYVIDPPLGSRDLGSKGSRNGPDAARDNLWYEGGSDLSEEELIRSRPEERHLRQVTALFCDGHAERYRVDTLDARAHGAPGDNRYYNGLFDSSRW